MKLRLVVRIEGDETLWQREVERPYPGVPRPDDWVYLSDDGAGKGLMATPVAVVTWENDGSVALRFDVAAASAYVRRQMEMLGFTAI